MSLVLSLQLVHEIRPSDWLSVFRLAQPVVVFGIENYSDWMRHLHISPHKSGYGCDTCMYPNLLYHMIRDTIPPSFAICHAISHRITQKLQAKTTSTKTDHLGAAYVLLWLLVSALFLPCLPPCFLSSLCCPSDGHITGLTVPLANINLVPSWSGLLRECMIVFVASASFVSFPVSFPLLFYTSKYFAWYRYLDIPNILSVVTLIRSENIQISHDIPRNVDTILNSSFYSTSYFSCLCECFLYHMPFFVLSGNKGKYIISLEPGYSLCFRAKLQRGSRLCVRSAFGFRMDNPWVLYTAWLLYLH